MNKRTREVVIVIWLVIALIIGGIVSYYATNDRIDAKPTADITKVEPKKDTVKRVKKETPKEQKEVTNDDVIRDRTATTSNSDNIQHVTDPPTTESPVAAASNDTAKKEPSRPVNEAYAEKTVEKPKTSDGQSLTMNASYYTASCDGCSGVTATGVDVRNSIAPNGTRIIAVDPSVIPLGSKVRVDTPYESFTAIAGDTGGGIQGNTVDILVGSKSEAIAKGRHNVTVTRID